MQMFRNYKSQNFSRSVEIMEKQKTRILDTIANFRCGKCGRIGRYEAFETSGGENLKPHTYGRVMHPGYGGAEPCHLGVLRRGVTLESLFRIPRSTAQKPKTMEDYKQLIDELLDASHILDEPKYADIKSEVLNNLCWRLPVHKKNRKEWQFRRYREVLSNMLVVIRELGTEKSYTRHGGKRVQKEFINVLKEWDIWIEQTNKRGQQ